MSKESQYFRTDLVKNQDINAPIDEKPSPDDIVKDPIEEFEEALMDLLVKSKNGTLYLFGDYGTGKTYVLNYYHAVMDEEWKGAYERETDFVIKERRIIPFKIDLNAVRSPSSFMNSFKERIEEEIGHEIDDKETIEILIRSEKEKHGWSDEQVQQWISDALTQKNPILSIKVSIEDEGRFRESLSALLSYVKSQGYDGVLFLLDEGELRYIAEEQRDRAYKDLDSLFRFMLPFLEGTDSPSYHGFYAVLAITPLTGMHAPEILSERGRAQQVFKLDEISDAVFIEMCKKKIERLIEERKIKTLPTRYFPFDEEIIEYLASEKCSFLPSRNIRAVLKAFRILLDLWNSGEANVIDYALLWEALPELPKAAIFRAKTFQEEKLEELSQMLNSFGGFSTAKNAQDALELFKQMFPKREPVPLTELKIAGEKIDRHEVINPLIDFCRERIAIFDIDLEKESIKINDDFRRALFLEKEKVGAVEYFDYLLSTYCGGFTHTNGFEKILDDINEISVKGTKQIKGRECLEVKSEPKHYPPIDAYVFLGDISSEIKTLVLKEIKNRNLAGGFVIIRENDDQSGVEFAHGCELELRGSTQDITGVLGSKIEAGRYRDRYPGDTTVEKLQNVIRLSKVREFEEKEQQIQQQKETSDTRIQQKRGHREDLDALLDSTSGLIKAALNEVSKEHFFAKMHKEYSVSPHYDKRSFSAAPQLLKRIMSMRMQGKAISKKKLDQMKSDSLTHDPKVEEECTKILQELNLISFEAGQLIVANRLEQSPCLKKIYGILQSMDKEDLFFKEVAPDKLLRKTLWLEESQSTGMKKYRMIIRSFVDILQIYGVVQLREPNGKNVIVVDPQAEYLKEIENLIHQYRPILSYRLIEEPIAYLEDLEILRGIKKRFKKEAKIEASPARAQRLRVLKEELEERYIKELIDFDFNQEETIAHKFVQNFDTLDEKIDEVIRNVSSFRSDAEEKDQLDLFVEVLNQWRSFFEGKQSQED